MTTKLPRSLSAIIIEYRGSSHMPTYNQCDIISFYVSTGWSDPFRITGKYPRGHEIYHRNTAKEYLDKINGHGIENSKNARINKEVYKIQQKDLGWLGLSPSMLNLNVMEVRIY